MKHFPIISLPIPIGSIIYYKGSDVYYLVTGYHNVKHEGKHYFDYLLRFLTPPKYAKKKNDYIMLEDKGLGNASINSKQLFIAKYERP